MPDVIDRPFPTMLMLFHPSAFASKIFLPMLRDLSEMLRAAGVRVSVAALDLSASPHPPHEFLWEDPPALGPHMQLVIPRATDGEAGLVDYDGHWKVVTLAEAAKRLAGPYSPAVPPEDLARLDAQVERLRDLLFELVFLGGSSESSGPSRRAASQSWLSRMFGSSGGSKTAPAEGDCMDCEELESRLDFSGGVALAICSCEDALRAVQ